MKLDNVITEAERREPATVGCTCIIIAGMHRSGTSALTRILNLLGCGVPQSLVPADQFNERGYWEAPEIAELNDAILGSVASSWEDWKPIDTSWMKTPARATFDARAAELLEQFFAGRRLFVLKDPRICRLLPFWRDALAAFGAQVRVLLSVREPIEIAASLLKRNGMNPSIAQLVWLRYVLDAEAESRDLPRTIVRYERLIDDWRSVVSRISTEFQLDLSCGSGAGEEIDAFLSPELRHHQASSAETLINSSPLEGPWIASVWEHLTAGAGTPDIQAQLDRIREEFDRAAATFARPVAELGKHGQYLKAKLEDAEATGTEVAKQRDLLSSEVERLAKTLHETQQNAAAVNALFKEARNVLVQHDAELTAWRQRSRRLELARLGKIIRRGRR